MTEGTIFSRPPPTPMNLRSAALSALFLLTTMIVVLGCRALVRRHIAPRTDTVRLAVIADLKACCHRKHLNDFRYTRYADIARRESRRQAEHLFRALAASSRIQERNCAKAVVRLGGTPLTDSLVPLTEADTDTHLERSIADERRQLERLDGRDIARALDADNRYAARLLIRAHASDLRHIRLMKECRLSDAPLPRYGVCPRCGTLYECHGTGFYCPHCYITEEQFLRF